MPLGDFLSSKWLIICLLVATSLGLVWASQTSNLTTLLCLQGGIGLVLVAPQLAIPMAVGLTSPDREGSTISKLLAGILGGIVFARTVGAAGAEWIGWQNTYLASAGVGIIVAGAACVILPATPASLRGSLGSVLLEPARLLMATPDLRRSCLYQAGVFAGFSGAWTTLVPFLSGPYFRLGGGAVSLLALVGIASLAGAPPIGRLVDKIGDDLVTLACIATAIVSVPVLSVGIAGGWWGLVALGGGMLLLDLATQWGQIANQRRALRPAPARRARANTAYMSCVSVAGAAGSYIGTRTYHGLGWWGTCGFIVTASSLAGAHLVQTLRRRHARTVRESPFDGRPARLPLKCG